MELFRNNFIAPFCQADEDLGIAEFGVFIFEIGGQTYTVPRI
jgi:hypothetical protein